MKRLSLVNFVLLALVLYAPCLVPAEDSEEIAPSLAHSVVVLEGSIGGALEVRLYLTIDPGGEGEGDGARRASGWYEYESIGKPISLSGSFDEGG